MTAEVHERRLHGVAIYNPDLLSKRELIAQFVARQDLLDQLVADLHRPGFNQHQILVGTRGMGKTTLLRRIRYAIEDDPGLAAVWLPLTFPEEQYNVGRLSDLYLNFIDALGDALEQSGRREEAGELDDAVEALPRGDEQRRASAALELLLGMAERLDRRLVMLIDNLDLIMERLEKQERAQWSFRELLSHENRLLLIGAMPVIIGATYDYEAPFYDFFRIHELHGLTRQETREVLTRLSREQNAPAVERLLETDPGRIDTLHTLTGGNPRTIALLFSVLAQGTEGDVRSDLEKLLDQCTPLYKARFEAMPPQSQQVVDAVAIHWDPISAGELADKLPMEVNTISSQLNRLVQQGILEKVEYDPPTKTGFQVAERFFNIWYLMRASRRVRRRLIWLVQFLRLFYGADQVKTKARDLLESALRDSSDEKLRHVELCLAIAQLIEDDRSTRFALESRAIRTLLTDQSLNEQIAAMLDLDGDDASLRDVVNREIWLDELRRAVDGAELDPDEMVRAYSAIASAPTSRQERLAVAKGLRSLSPEDRLELYERFDRKLVELGENFGTSFATSLVIALRNGFMNGLDDWAGASLGAAVLGFPELEAYAVTDKPERLERLQVLASLAGKSHFITLMLAEALAEAGRYDEAGPFLNRIESGERCTLRDFVSGLILAGLGRIEEATERFDRTGYEPTVLREAWHHVAATQADLTRYEPAVKALEQLLATEQDADTLAVYARVLTRAERYAEAESAARAALEREPKHVAAAAALATSLLLVDRQDEALMITQSARKSADPHLLRVHAAALLAVGNVAEGVAVVRQLASRVTDGRLLLQHVALLFAVDAADDAITNLHRVLAAGPEAVVEITPAIVETLRVAVSRGHAARVLGLVEELQLEDALRPAYEALRIIVSGRRTALRRLAPEVQQATAEILDRWLPEKEPEKKPRKKAASKRRSSSLT